MTDGGEEIYYIPVNGNTGMSNPLHAVPDCPTLQGSDTVQEVTRRQCPNRPLCERCVGDGGPPHDGAGHDGLRGMVERGEVDDEHLVTDGGQSEEKPTPPVPPSDSFTHPDQQRGSRVLESETVDTCDCGGRIVEKQVATGRIVVHVWDHEEWDADEYRLEADHKQTERRVECDRCGVGWSY